MRTMSVRPSTCKSSSAVAYPSHWMAIPEVPIWEAKPLVAALTWQINLVDDGDDL